MERRVEEQKEPHCQAEVNSEEQDICDAIKDQEEIGSQ